MIELGIYIHIPFCVRKCRYCDFLSFPFDNLTGHEEKMEAYVNALCEEIKCFFQKDTIETSLFQETPVHCSGLSQSQTRELQSYKKQQYRVTSIYLGGGTPSILPPALTEKILSAIYQYADVARDAEITTEANPGTLTKEKLRSYQRSGINRLSLGLQSTVEKELAYLGRIHSYEDFLKSYDMAVQTGFDNINIDLMSAIPYQTMTSWELSLNRVLKLQPAHISAYSLIIEEGTPFYEDGNLSSLIPDEDTERRMYELTEQMLCQEGYHRYEVSNYSKPGKECRHNLLYWDRRDYIGFGLNSASCLNEVRFTNTKNLEAYLKNPWTELSDREEREVLSHREQMEEAMILGLRKIEGISSREFQRRYGEKMEDIFQDVITRYEKEGLLQWKEDRLSFTKRGLDVSNMVLCEFLP